MGLFKLFDKNIAKIAPFAFVILTLIFSLLKIPFFDETHAYIISRFDISQIFYLSRIEGHPILWYLILKPFNSLNLYPYSIMLINWFFASIMIFVFWKKAPFDNLTKFLITFSYPFFQYLGVVSRPYALGVLIIFLITSIYKDCLKKPLFYSFLLVLCANISVMTFFVAFSFSLLFFYEIFKKKTLSKKQLKLVFLIFSVGFLLLCMQFLFLEKPTMQLPESVDVLLRQLSYFFINPFLHIQFKNFNQVLLQFISLVSFYYFSYLLFKKYKPSFFFSYILIFSLLTFFVCVYVGNFWHYYFIFIALICALWMAWDKIKDVKFARILFILLIISNMSSYAITNNGRNTTAEPIFYKKTLNIILNNEKYKNAKLFSFDNYTHLSPGIVVYLKKLGITLYDNHNNDKMSFESIRNIQKIEYRYLKIQEFYKYLDPQKDNYLLGTSNKMADYQSFEYSEGNIKIYLDLVEYHPEIYLIIYKIRYEIMK